MYFIVLEVKFPGIGLKLVDWSDLMCTERVYWASWKWSSWKINVLAPSLHNSSPPTTTISYPGNSERQEQERKEKKGWEERILYWREIDLFYLRLVKWRQRGVKENENETESGRITTQQHGKIWTARWVNRLTHNSVLYEMLYKNPIKCVMCSFLLYSSHDFIK